MTLRTKTLLIVALTLLGLLVVISFACSRVLNANLTALEEQETGENVERVRDALTQTLKQMNTTTTSWAQWKATCQFLQDKNRAYYNENLTPATITTMKSDIVVFFDSKGRIVFGTNHNLKAVKNLPLDPRIRALITPNNPLLHHASTREGHMGILDTSHDLLMVVTRPIVNDTATGAIHGTLLTGVYLDAQELKRLSELTHLPLALHRMNSAALPADFQSAVLHLNSAQSTWVNPISNSTVSGYTLLPDIYGKQAFLLRVDLERDIFHLGQLGIRNVVGALVLSGIIFGLVTLLLLERLVISRISLLSNEVSSISLQHNFSGSVSVQGEDELGQLSVHINGLLEALQDSLVKEESARHKIERTLREKEVLLKEVYHRVKNNLQIVSSLLNLQADTIDDPQVQAMFEESQSRVRSMALVHEKLYQSDDLAHINFGDYLDNLANSLVRSYNNAAGRVSLKLETEEAVLDIDRAVPCGLIVNELITNALKYAFPDGRSGTIHVTLKTKDDGLVALGIADDGVGIPSHFNVEESESIGMQLVTGLSQQLQGTYELSGDNGTKWTIFFKAQKRP